MCLGRGHTSCHGTCQLSILLIQYSEKTNCKLVHSWSNQVQISKPTDENFDSPTVFCVVLCRSFSVIYRIQPSIKAENLLLQYILGENIFHMARRHVIGWTKTKRNAIIVYVISWGEQRVWFERQDRKKSNEWPEHEHGQQINVEDYVHESKDFRVVPNFQCLTSRDLICSYSFRLCEHFSRFLCNWTIGQCSSMLQLLTIFTLRPIKHRI